jgi:hypothetical protein
MQIAPWILSERGFCLQHLLQAREPREAERARNKVDGLAVGNASEGGTREAEPRRLQSDRGEVRPREGPVRVGTDKGQVTGNLGIVGGVDNHGDESDYDGQPGRLSLLSFYSPEYSADGFRNLFRK